jgi:hypothetical protein
MPQPTRPWVPPDIINPAVKKSWVSARYDGNDLIDIVPLKINTAYDWFHLAVNETSFDFVQADGSSSWTKSPTFVENVYNGHDTFRFDGVNERLTGDNAYAQGVGRFTVITVAKSTLASGTGVVFNRSTSAQTYQALLALQIDATTGQAVAGGRRLASDGFDSVGMALPSGLNILVADGKYSSAEIRVGVNGAYTSKTSFQSAGNTESSPGFKRRYWNVR